VLLVPVKIDSTDGRPENGSVAGIAGLREALLIAALAENLLLLKHEGGVVQLLVAAAAGEVLRVPHLAHCTRKWTSYGFVARCTHSLTIHHLLLAGG